MIHFSAILFILTVNAAASDQDGPYRSQNVDLQLHRYSGPLDDKALRSKFSELIYLDIRSSNLTSFPSEMLKKFKNLESLSITFSDIHKEEDEVFKNCCPKLNILYIRSWNEFKPEDLRGIGTLPLQQLEIMDQNLPTLKDEMFENKELKALRLINDRIETIDPSAFKNLIGLVSLVIRENRLKTFPTEALKPLKKLQTIEFGSNGLKTVNTEDIPELPELKKILFNNEILRECNFTDVSLKVPSLDEILLLGNVGVKVYGNSSIVHNF